MERTELRAEINRILMILAVIAGLIVAGLFIKAAFDADRQREGFAGRSASKAGELMNAAEIARQRPEKN